MNLLGGHKQLDHNSVLRIHFFKQSQIPLTAGVNKSVWRPNTHLCMGDMLLFWNIRKIVIFVFPAD